MTLLVRIGLPFLFLSLWVHSLKAQRYSSLDTLITLNSYHFEIIDGKIVGSGKEFLEKELRESQFFMIGELHGNEQTPLFTASILPLAKKLGYNYLGLEIGPYSNKVLRSVLDQRGGKDSLAQFYRKYDTIVSAATNPIPFFDVLDEVEMLETAYSLEFETWGLDQEFLSAPKFLFDTIYELIPEDERDEQYRQLYNEAKKNLYSLLEDSTEDEVKFKLLLENQYINDFLYTSGGVNNEARQIAEAIKKSWLIYYYSGFDANNERAILMRRYFNEYYQKALQKEKHPKMLLKMGSMHTVYGRTANTIYDIGNTLYEVALLNNSKAFNIALAGRYYIRSTGEKIDRLEFVPEYEKLFEFEKENIWTIVDLRAIKKALYNREVSMPNLDRTFIDLLMRYDAVLMTTLKSATRETRNYKKE